MSVHRVRLATRPSRFRHAARERAGQRCLPIYVWTFFPENFAAAHIIEVFLSFETGGNASIQSYPITYYPFQQEELRERLPCAGFGKSETRPGGSQVTYRVIAS